MRGADPLQRRMIGISEWNYDIPVVYKLLASGSPRTSISSIWKLDENIAIVGDYETGLRRLTGFLDQLPKELIEPIRNEAVRFLSSPRNRRKFFVLECAEIYDMQGENLAEQNDQLLEEIKVFKPGLVGSEEEINALGLGNWSNILYFDLNDAA
jgi:hypothetical protein